MQKVVIVSNAKLQDNINYWKQKFSDNNYEVLDYPKAIEKEILCNFIPVYTRNFLKI